MEQALQSVDPSIAMPYWEYGMDSYLYDSWMDSPVFDDDWFGTANPLSDLHVLTAGLFSGISLPDGSAYNEWSITETGTLNPFVNAYGDLRSPWNNNPSKMIGRHNLTYGASLFQTVPTCTALSSCFSSTSLSDVRQNKFLLP